MLRFIRNKGRPNKRRPPSGTEAGGLDIKLVADNWNRESTRVSQTGEENDLKGTNTGTTEDIESADYMLNSDTPKEEGNIIDFEALFAEVEARAAASANQVGDLFVEAEVREPNSETVVGIVGISEGPVEVKRSSPLGKPSWSSETSQVRTEGDSENPTPSSSEQCPHLLGTPPLTNTDFQEHTKPVVNLQDQQCEVIQLSPGIEHPSGGIKRSFGEVEQEEEEDLYHRQLPQIKHSPQGFVASQIMPAERVYYAMDYEDPEVHMKTAFSDPALSLNVYAFDDYDYGYGPEGGRPYPHAMPPVFSNGNLRSKKPELRVSFRDDDSVIMDKSHLSDATLDTTSYFTNVPENGIQFKHATLNRAPYFVYRPKTDTATKPVFEEYERDGKKVEDSDDCLSVGSEASDMSESDLRPATLLLRRTIALGGAWLAMVSSVLDVSHHCNSASFNNH